MNTLDQQIDYLRKQLGIRDSQVLNDLLNSYANAQISLQNQLVKQQQKIDKAIEEIDDILYYWCELCEVEWVELRIEDFTNIFKKLKSILEGMEGEDK